MIIALKCFIFGELNDNEMTEYLTDNGDTIQVNVALEFYVAQMDTNLEVKDCEVKKYQVVLFETLEGEQFYGEEANIKAAPYYEDIINQSIQ